MKINQILGNSVIEKSIIGIVYLLIFSGLFLPYMEITTTFKVNNSSFAISETKYYISVVKGYESGTFLFILLFTIFIHFRTIIINRSSNIVALIIWLFAFITYVLIMKTVATAGWGAPTGSQTLIGFDLSIVSISILIVYSFYLNIVSLRK